MCPGDGWRNPRRGAGLLDRGQRSRGLVLPATPEPLQLIRHTKSVTFRLTELLNPSLSLIWDQNLPEGVDLLMVPAPRQAGKEPRRGIPFPRVSPCGSGRGSVRSRHLGSGPGCRSCRSPQRDELPERRGELSRAWRSRKTCIHDTFRRPLGRRPTRFQTAGSLLTARINKVASVCPAVMRPAGAHTGLCIQATETKQRR